MLKGVAEFSKRTLIGGVLIALPFFVAGLLVRTGPGLRAKNALEQNLLDRIPGYALLRGLAARVAGCQEGGTFALALVEIEEALVPAFIVE